MRGTTDLNNEKGQFHYSHGVFSEIALRELVPPLVASIMAKFEQIMERFGNILKQSLKSKENIE